MSKYTKSLIKPVLLASLLLSALPAQADDGREYVELPAMMRTHMLGNMRDHLAAITEIQAALAAGQYERASDIAENRLGMSSLQRHGASHMARYMPKDMARIGTAMHHAASRFARTAQEAAVDRDLAGALGALNNVTRQCLACHARYKIHQESSE